MTAGSSSWTTGSYFVLFDYSSHCSLRSEAGRDGWRRKCHRARRLTGVTTQPITSGEVENMFKCSAVSVREHLNLSFEILHLFPFATCFYIWKMTLFFSSNFPNVISSVSLSVAASALKVLTNTSWLLSCTLYSVTFLKGKNAQLLQCVCHNILLPLGSRCFGIKPAVAACSVPPPPPLRTCWEPGPLPRSCLLALGSVELHVTRSLNPALNGSGNCWGSEAAKVARPCFSPLRTSTANPSVCCLSPQVCCPCPPISAPTRRTSRRLRTAGRMPMPSWSWGRWSSPCWLPVWAASLSSVSTSTPGLPVCVCVRVRPQSPSNQLLFLSHVFIR